MGGCSSSEMKCLSLEDMKKQVLIILSVLAFAQVHAQLTEAQKEILLLENQRISAVASHDAGFLANLYDDGYYGVASSGAQMHKAEQLESFKSRNSFVTYSYDELIATVYGTTAVITGKQVTKSKAGSVLGQTRYILILSNLSGKWKVVTGQETDVISK